LGPFRQELQSPKGARDSVRLYAWTWPNQGSLIGGAQYSHEKDVDPFGGNLFAAFPTDQPYPSNEKLHAHLFEQYKLCVELADRISARRQTGNSSFLTVNTALF
jgi:hypothetical protein